MSLDRDHRRAHSRHATVAAAIAPAGRGASPSASLAFRADAVAMQSISPFPDANGQQQKERDWLVVTVPRRDGSVLYFVFVAPQAEFERFRPTFDNMLQSVQF